MKYKITELLHNQHVAHRGLWDKELAENSAAAFNKALEKGYDIELDAHLMKDGNFAVFHDFTLKRMCNKAGYVCKLTEKDLSSCHLNGTDQTIPNLRDILKMVNGKVTLFLEVKVIFNWKKYAVALKNALSSYDGAIVLHGLNRKVLRYLQANTSYPVAVLSLKAKQWKGDFIPDALTIILSALPVKNRSKYPPLISWTVNCEKDREKAEANSDAYLTNINKLEIE